MTVTLLNPMTQTILVVDDEAKLRDMLRVYLEQEGYRVVRFWNSEINDNLTGVLERIYVELYGSREAEAVSLKHQRRRR